MKLIIGIGNPGPSYDHTRHNMGFLLLDHIAEEYGAHWQHKPKFKGNVAEIRLGSETILLLKPDTFYNLSGEAVRSIVDFYKISSQDILALHDELALPFGTLRTRVGGRDAGNNGIKNIIAHIGPDFARLRIGIASTEHPVQDAAAFVLGKLTSIEKTQLPALYKHAHQLVEDFIHEDREFAHTSIKI